jgi:cyclopropane fatty-acyl-phospholipid synthase-like methyltransferase
VTAKGAVPRRIEWAVSTLAVRPDERLLEIGRGGGVAAALVAERLRDGTITAIDRSAKAIAAAGKRNASAIEAGRVALRTAALAEVDIEGEPFDTIFAINVNVFWTGPATAELDRIRALLKPEGRLFLFYEPPDPAGAQQVAETVSASLSAAGFAVNRVTGDGMSLVCIVGEPP